MLVIYKSIVSCFEDKFVAMFIKNKYEVGFIGSCDLNLVIKTIEKLMMTFMKFSHIEFTSIGHGII
jgi:hypothetical protein